MHHFTYLLNFDLDKAPVSMPNMAEMDNFFPDKPPVELIGLLVGFPQVSSQARNPRLRGAIPLGLKH
jgi:hypothetical protein